MLMQKNTLIGLTVKVCNDKMRLVICFLFFFQISFAQRFFEPADSLHLKRQKAVGISQAALATGTLIGLNQLWYASYPRSKFHFVDDNSEWLQMDKVGHVYSSYQLGRLSAELWQWSGASKKQQRLYGAGMGFAFLTAVEVMDGFSQEWGASVGDVVANATGTGLYLAQDLLWEEQRIIPKFSFHQTSFAKFRPEVLGANLTEQILKDYNGQTYWLSVNLHSFAKQSKLPKWLNIALGYGADGMLAGNSKDQVATGGFNARRTRQFYLSLDVDLTKIKTQSPVLKTVFSLINTIKVPAPTLEISQFGDIKYHFVYF